MLFWQSECMTPEITCFHDSFFITSAVHNKISHCFNSGSGSDSKILHFPRLSFFSPVCAKNIRMLETVFSNIRCIYEIEYTLCFVGVERDNHEGSKLLKY